MDVKIENYINVWYDQIPPLLIDLINTITLARDEKELREVIDHFHKNTSLKGMFAYGFGKHHFWLKQRKVSDPSKLMEHRILVVEF